MIEGVDRPPCMGGRGWAGCGGAKMKIAAGLV